MHKNAHVVVLSRSDQQRMFFVSLERLRRCQKHCVFLQSADQRLQTALKSFRFSAAERQAPSANTGEREGQSD